MTIKGNPHGKRHVPLPHVVVLVCEDGLSTLHVRARLTELHVVVQDGRRFWRASGRERRGRSERPAWRLSDASLAQFRQAPA